MVTQLFKQKAIKNWNLEIEEMPVTIQSQMLAAPQMIAKNQIIHCDDNALRKQSIVKPRDLLKE